MATLAIELFPHPKQLIWKTETESRKMQRLIGITETERNKNRLGKQKQKHKQEGKTDCWENRNRKKQKETETDWEHINRNRNKKHWFAYLCSVFVVRSRSFEFLQLPSV